MICGALSNRRLMTVISALCLTACGRAIGTPAAEPSATPTPWQTTLTPTSTPTPTPTLSAPAGSYLIVSGDRNGNVVNIRATCGREQRVGTLANDYVATYLSADGSLNGDAFYADIFDPAGPGNWEGQIHVYVRVTPPNSGDNGYYTWLTQSSDGISEFRAKGGVTLAANVPSRGTANIQAGGLVPNGPITVTGMIVC